MSRSKRKNLDPRLAMWERLPRWQQKSMSALTGKVGPGEKELFRHTGTSRFALTLLQFLLGTIGSGWAAHGGGMAWGLLPITTLLTAGAVRAFQTTFLHHGSHGTLTENEVWNDFMAEVASTLGWLSPLGVYRTEHGPHHAKTATKLDPDLRFVTEKLGFTPGRTRAESWEHVWRLLRSPRLHASQTLTRIHANLIAATGWRRLAAWAHLLGLIGFATWTGLGFEMAIALLPPLIPLYTIAAVLQTVSEHTWVHIGQGRDPKKIVVTRLTRDRYFGEAPPEPGAGIGAWAKFYARMLLVYAPLRVWVVPLDLVAHSWHHRHPNDKRWPRWAFARRDDEPKAEADGVPYEETWGSAEALDSTFAHLALVPPDANLGEPESYGWIDPDLLQM